MCDRRRERHGSREHGTSEVRVVFGHRGGSTTLVLLDDRREPIEEIRREVEPDVRYANIATIEGTAADFSSARPFACRSAKPIVYQIRRDQAGSRRLISSAASAARETVNALSSYTPARRKSRQS